MIDSFVIAAPFLLLLIVGLLQFVGCNAIWGLGDVHEGQREAITIQQAPVATVETFNNDHVSAQFTYAVAAGDLIIVWLFYDSAVESVSSVVDDALNSYDRAVGPTAGPGLLAGLQQEIWYAANVNAPTDPDTGITVKATFTAVFNARKAIVVHDYKGAQKVSPLDQSAANIGTTTVDDRTVRTGQRAVAAAELVFAAAVFHGTHGAPGAGFGVRSTADDNMSEDQVVTVDASIEATFTTQPMTDWVAQMATFIAQQDVVS